MGVWVLIKKYTKEGRNGHGAWSRAVKLYSFLLASSQCSPSEKKDIGWNKEQNIKSPACVLRDLNSEPEFSVELLSLLVCLCPVLLNFIIFFFIKMLGKVLF